MKKILGLSVMLLFAFILKAQSVDDVINDYITVMGGKEKLQSIKSLHQVGIANMNGNEITTTVDVVQDKLYRSETNFGMGTSTMLIVGDKGWSKNPRNGGNFEAMPDDRVKNMQAMMDCAGGPLVDYATKGNKVELIGKEDVEGTECYKVKLTLKSGREVNYFFDAKTHFVNRTTQKGGMGGGNRGGAGGGSQVPQEMKTDYSNYQKTADGYMFAMSITRGGGMMGGGTMTFEKIDVNQPVDEKLYKAE